jgi:hypothetical protein
MTQSEKSARTQAGKIFDELHRPDSFVRQLADWRRSGPTDPPPLVAQAIKQASKTSARLTRNMSPTTHRALKRGD